MMDLIILSLRAGLMMQILFALIIVTIKAFKRAVENMRTNPWLSESGTFSFGSLLMVLRGRRTLSTRKDLIVLMSLPLLFL